MVVGQLINSLNSWRDCLPQQVPSLRVGCCPSEASLGLCLCSLSSQGWRPRRDLELAAAFHQWYLVLRRIFLTHWEMSGGIWNAATVLRTCE